MSRTALITGATSEIGQSIVRGLVERGVDCAITARRGDLLEEVARRHANGASRVVPMVADMTDAGDLKAAVAQTGESIGGPDILVHVAAQSAIEPILEFSDEDWRRDFAVNVDAAFALAKLVAPGMRKAGWGRIITIGSVYASFSANPWFYQGKWGGDAGAGPERNPGYMASKGALKMLTRDLAATFGPWGITANMVSPGMIRIADRPIDPERLRRYELMTPIGRMGRADDISNAVVFLAGEESGFITGSDLVVDGGWSIW
jgi:3-oxoacyl-[acyl-carrier protein] reductase